MIQISHRRLLPMILIVMALLQSMIVTMKMKRIQKQAKDADCDGYLTANDCDDSNGNAFENNGLSSAYF